MDILKAIAKTATNMALSGLLTKKELSFLQERGLFVGKSIKFSKEEYIEIKKWFDRAIDAMNIKLKPHGVNIFEGITLTKNGNLSFIFEFVKNDAANNQIKAVAKRAYKYFLNTLQSSKERIVEDTFTSPYSNPTFSMVIRKSKGKIGRVEGNVDRSSALVQMSRVEYTLEYGICLKENDLDKSLVPITKLSPSVYNGFALGGAWMSNKLFASLNKFYKGDTPSVMDDKESIASAIVEKLSFKLAPPETQDNRFTVLKKLFSISGVEITKTEAQTFTKILANLVVNALKTKSFSITGTVIGRPPTRFINISERELAVENKQRLSVMLFQNKPSSNTKAFTIALTSSVEPSLTSLMQVIIVDDKHFKLEYWTLNKSDIPQYRKVVSEVFDIEDVKDIRYLNALIFDFDKAGRRTPYTESMLEFKSYL